MENKILIKDFIESYNENKDLSGIEIKKYLPYNDKLSLISELKDSKSGIQIIDGVSVYNSLAGGFGFDIQFIKYCTNLEYTIKNYEEEHDFLCENGILNHIISAIENDYSELYKHYQNMVQALLLVENDSRNILNREIAKVSTAAIKTLEDISGKVDKRSINKLVKSLGSFDMNNTISNLFNNSPTTPTQ